MNVNSYFHFFSIFFNNKYILQSTAHGGYMDIVAKVAHKVLTKGDILKSPSGGKEWVVVESAMDSEDKQHIKLACISKYMQKNEKELEEWFIKKK